MLGKIQKDWKKLVQMKIYYFAAIAHVGVFVKNYGCVYNVPKNRDDSSVLKILFLFLKFSKTESDQTVLAFFNHISMKLSFELI